ncbi:MAG TPA: aminoglycoside 6-adenylyltransferase [Rubrobacter sp.]|nr:aminoglycoside 6-adenylyltransferase [Rubrobacter sp.]
MDNVPGLDRLPVHRALLERAVDCFRDDDRVVGMILGGSMAHGAVDFYSDVDLYIVVRDESFEAVFDERDVAAGATGPPLFCFDVDPIPGGSRDYIVTYPGPIKLDLMYHRESEIRPDQKWVGCPVLKDHSGSLVDVVSRSAGSHPDLPEPRELLELDQKFWTWCWYVFGKIMRGELWEALDGIHTIRGEVILLMLDWTGGRRHEGYRRLERKLDPETAARFAATVAPLAADALYEALQAAIALFRDLREPVFELCGLTFDPALEDEIRVEMSRRWAARGA